MWHIRFGKVRGSQHLNMLLSPMSCFVINADTPYANNHSVANLYLVVQHYFYRCNRDTHLFCWYTFTWEMNCVQKRNRNDKMFNAELEVHSIKFVVYVKIVFKNNHVIWNCYEFITFLVVSMQYQMGMWSKLNWSWQPIYTFRWNADATNNELIEWIKMGIDGWWKL